MGESGFGFLAAIAARTAIVFIMLLAGLRLTGKRQAGEMNVRDLLLVLVIANAVQNAMTQGNGSLAVALVAAGTIILLGWLAALLIAWRGAWQAAIAGGPTVLVQDGRVIRRNMRQEGVTEDDLMAAVRGQGLDDVAGVRLAVLEADGSISVVPREPAHGG